MRRQILDVNEIRSSAISLYGLTKADEVYTIYHDETNNIRRLHVRSDGLNVREPKCFVIGGVAHSGPYRDLKIAGLQASLRIQKSANEIKLKHVATGELLDLLKASKLESFMKWVIEQGLFVHYSVLDPLYWSIVDIIDSILTEYGEAGLLMANWEFKNDLYTILRYDYDGTVEIFQRYSYPDVGRRRRPGFVAELCDLLEQRRDLLPHFNYMMLKGVLQIAGKLQSLPYLEDETPNVLIDGFGIFYVNRICLFKNAEHILDVEEVVAKYLNGLRFMDGERELTNYRFAISDNEAGIQISDVITGLIGKFFSFTCNTDRAELAAERRVLDPQQKRNLLLLKILLDRSLNENAAFAHFVLSLEDQSRAAFFLGN